MNGLRDNLQLVLQTQKSSGDFVCEGFKGIPAVNPGMIVIATPDSSSSRQEGDRLRQELISALLSLSPNAQLANTPCDGRIGSMLSCHAHGVTFCQKLLVLLGDAQTGFFQSKDLVQWAEQVKNDSSYRILPVFPRGAAVPTLLPAELQSFNTFFWSGSVSEVIPQILALIGLTTQEYRIFISYRRADTQPLADQLFDALSHKNFDVFLDRFRNPPGVNFPIRLLQELADKSMVLILESPNILVSPWTRLEIIFSRLYRLGLVALQIPGAARISGIGPEEREYLKPSDFVRSGNDILTPTALDSVVNRIIQEHDRALIRRREILRASMRYALLLAGVYQQKLGADGFLRIKSRKDYSVWLTTRPLEVPDFQITHLNLQSQEKGIVLGPAVFEPTRKAKLDWLSAVSQIKHYDEGRLWLAAREMARGV